MHPYFIKLLFRVVQVQPEIQFEEQFRMIYAGNKDEALIKAQLIGEKEEETFLNIHGEVVSWEFSGISGIQCITSMQDGTEFFSRTLEIENPGIFEEEIQQNNPFIHSAPLSLSPVEENVHIKP